MDGSADDGIFVASQSLGARQAHPRRGDLYGCEHHMEHYAASNYSDILTVRLHIRGIRKSKHVILFFG
jgi:hypothetical protein